MSLVSALQAAGDAADRMLDELQRVQRETSRAIVEFSRPPVEPMTSNETRQMVTALATPFKARSTAGDFMASYRLNLGALGAFAADQRFRGLGAFRADPRFRGLGAFAADPRARGFGAFQNLRRFGQPAVVTWTLGQKPDPAVKALLEAVIQDALAQSRLGRVTSTTFGVLPKFFR